MKKKIYDELKRRVDNLERLLNGGPGSGNFGHSGRPGKVGGSGSGKGSVSEKWPVSESKDSGVGREDGPDITQHIANTAQVSIDKANKEEPEVTETLGKVFKENGATFAGLKYRVKSRSSLADKMSRDLAKEEKEPTNENIQEVARNIHDNLRYTAVCSEDRFGEQAKGIMKGLEKEGYEMVRIKNTLKDENAPYRGVNTLVKNKNGYIFELQFHTAQSVKVKEQNHIDYNVQRDPKTSESEKERLEELMKSRSKSIRMPKGVETIEPMDKLKG